MPDRVATVPQPNRAFRWTQVDGARETALVCEPLMPHARHLFTTRRWPLGAAQAEDRAWDDVAAAVGVEPDRLIRLRQVHGAAVFVHRQGDPLPAERPVADVAVTDDPHVALAIQTADCVSILLADRRTNAVAGAHAGWRGLAAGVPAVAVDAIRRDFGTRPNDLVAALGPSISGPRYEVGSDVYDRFSRAPGLLDVWPRWFSAGVRPDHWQFDGWRSATDQLIAAGVPPAQIFAADLCTVSSPDVLCSYRRDGQQAGRMAAAIRCAPPLRP